MATSLVDRLLRAQDPYDYQEWKNREGYYVATCSVSSLDIPQLIEVVKQWPKDCVDRTFPDAEIDLDDEGVDLLPVTAWRALADLKAENCVEPLLEMLEELDAEIGDFDDWSFEELPHVFGKIGPAAIDPLVRRAEDRSASEPIRSIVVRGLGKIAEYWPETRVRIASALAKLLIEAQEEEVKVNTSLMNELVVMKATEAAEAIERAFSRNLVDVGMRGDWEEVRKELGVESLGLPMPEEPHNSIQAARIKMGLGIFSNKPLYFEGELDEQAEKAYCDLAYEQFVNSPEGEEALVRYSGLIWHRSLLDYGNRYLGEIVDEMTVSSVEEYVFDFIPRKVTTEPESAAEIIGELTLFWKFLDRQFSLPHAKAIVAWLQSDGIVEQLQHELADPRNYGMAKSFFTSGMAAGYDMTSEEGMNEYMAAFNASLARTEPRDPEPPLTPQLFKGRPVGRNDPCPCGSGKKYKKCCKK